MSALLALLGSTAPANRPSLSTFSEPPQSRAAGKVAKQEAQVQDSMLQRVDPLCSQKGQL